MKVSKENLTRIEKILIKAYGKKETAKRREVWQTKVMSHIHRLGPVKKAKQNNPLVFDQFLWRLAPVASVLILILATFMLSLDFVSEYEMAKIFIDDPIEFSLFQSFLI